MSRKKRNKFNLIILVIMENKGNLKDLFLNCFGKKFKTQSGRVEYLIFELFRKWRGKIQSILSSATFFLN
jgi:hypothetical protein